MGEESKIQWTHATFNPWRGCTKVSPGCQHCYAEAQSRRNPGVLGEWGPNGRRVIAAESYWRQPLKWDQEARAAGERRRVFCASLADVFEDRADLIEPRARLLGLIHDTPNLDWLLLTKRPVTWAKVMRETIDSGKLRVSEFKRGFKHWMAVDWLNGRPPKNVWLGVSVEDQQRSDERIPILLEIPAAVRFLSCEPLLGPVDLRRLTIQFSTDRCRYFDSVSSLNVGGEDYPARRLHWVIVGGESGTNARPCDVAWIRSIRDQCKAAGVACFIKQIGARPFVSNGCGRAIVDPSVPIVPRRDPKGGNIDEWPEDLRVREFPQRATPCLS